MRFRILVLLLLVGAVLLPLVVLADEPQPKSPVLPVVKTVSLSGTMKLSAALAAVKEQTGIAVEDRRGEPDVDITVDLKKVTCWQALDQIAEAAHAQVDSYTADGNLSLKKHSGKPDWKDAQTVSYDGLFRTSLKRITASRDLETGESTYQASFEVVWLPTLLPFFFETRPQNLVVKIDDDPKELAPINLGLSKAPADGCRYLSFNTLLPTPPRTAKKIGHMSGNFSIIAPNNMLAFAFEKSVAQMQESLTKNNPTTPTMTLQGVECAIGKITLTKDRWSIRVTLNYPPGNIPNLDTSQSWVVNNELVLESKDGKMRIPAATYYIDQMTATHASVTYNFQSDPKQKRVLGKAEDWKLSYLTPEAVVTIPIAFSFKNVPLP